MNLLEKLVQRQKLTAAEAEQMVDGIIDGTYSDTQIGALIIALKMKGETEEEIAALVNGIKKHSISINLTSEAIVDSCGTGGDGMHTFNVSTTAALIAAGAGVIIAKHGNRSVSSKSGSADVLEELGIKILEPEMAKKCIEKTNFGFLFAPYYHPVFKKLAPIRSQLGVRTVFNILGPLLNPANAKHQLLGVYDSALAQKMVGVLQLLGTKHAMVVHSNGMDEISLGKTLVYELKNNRISKYILNARDFGFSEQQIPAVSSAKESAAIIGNVLSGQKGAARDVSLLNAGALIYLGGKAKSIEEGVELARQSVETGAAGKKLEEVRAFGNSGGS
ncbi:anthranilate phosphoribosyltransferase [Candidatus Micrarchaeota archaeon]|nr:anthranilate phosphoribosyltransferase [Candidatus Micrarchaeota archaeon]